MPLLAAVTCLSEQGGSAAVGDCVRWAGAMPALVQECLIPCKDDCTFTPWSKFTACSSDCDAARSRRRSLTGIIFYNVCLIGNNALAVLEWWENPDRTSLIAFSAGTDHCQPYTHSSIRAVQNRWKGFRCKPNEKVTRQCASLSDLLIWGACRKYIYRSTNRCDFLEEV